jgi:hypothetical protein
MGSSTDIRSESVSCRGRLGCCMSCEHVDQLRLAAGTDFNLYKLANFFTRNVMNKPNLSHGF